MDYNNENNYYVDNTHLDFSKIPTANPQEQASDSNMGLAITSMVIGILSLTLCCICGSLLGILGLVFGIIALVKKQKGTGMAIAGVITSILGFLVGILILLYIVVVASTTKAILNSPDFQYYMEEYEEFDFEEFEDYDFSRFENFYNIGAATLSDWCAAPLSFTGRQSEGWGVFCEWCRMVAFSSIAL